MILLRVACFALLALPMAAQAQIPHTDVARMAQAIKENFRKINEQAQRKAAMVAESVQGGVLAAQKIDGWNNATANGTIRTNQQSTDVYNLDVARNARPAMHSCLPYGVSISLEEALCEQSDRVEERAIKADNASLAQAPEFAAAITGKPVAEFTNRSANGQSAGATIIEPGTVNLQGIPALMGIPPSHDELMSDELGILLEVVFPPFMTNPARKSWSDENTLVELQSMLRTNLAGKSAESVAARRAETDGVSEAGLLQTFATEHFSDQRLTDLTTEQTLTEAAMWRERSTSQAFRVWRSLNEFELALEAEVLLSVRLLNAIDGK